MLHVIAFFHPYFFYFFLSFLFLLIAYIHFQSLTSLSSATSNYRSSHLEVFSKNYVLKNLAKLTVKHMCRRKAAG